MKSAPAIVFDYTPSRWVSAGACAVLAAGFFALALCALPLWIKLIVALCVCAYAAYDLYRFHHHAVHRAAWYEAGHWRLAGSDNAEQSAELATGIVRGSWIVLRLQRNDDRPVTLILGPDNSEAELRRRLRVRLARTREQVG